MQTNINVGGRVPMSAPALLEAAGYFHAKPSRKSKLEGLLMAWDFGLSGVKIKEEVARSPDGEELRVVVPIGLHGSAKKAFSLPFMLESSGTQGAFILMSKLLPALRVGGIAVIDEFESDLHPHMLGPILGLFADRSTNPRSAQILFSTHAVEVLNLLEKTQVMFVEKDKLCESHAYRMDTVAGIRNDDNFHAKYMAGAYGAVPDL
jgi:hypothetical protein